MAMTDTRTRLRVMLHIIARLAPPPGAAASPKRLTKVAYLQFATKPVWAQNPDSQPPKVHLSHT